MKSKETHQDELQTVRNTLMQLGFTSKQADKMIATRAQRTHTSVPFHKTDIRARYEDFQQLFKPYQLKKEELNALLSTGLIFSMHPQQYKKLFEFIENRGVSVRSFLKILQTENGSTVFTRSPQSLIKNVNEVSAALAPYGMTPQKWIEMGIKRPTILKQTSQYLLNNMQQITSHLSEQGFSQQDWVSAGMLNPGLLDRNAQKIIEKNKEMARFLSVYDVKPSEWTQACFKIPQLFYTDPAYIQERFRFYTEAYESGQFIFTNLEKQDTKHLIKTLLTSPQYLCYSAENLALRKAYMDYMNKTTGQATSAVLFRTLTYIKNALQNG